MKLLLFAVCMLVQSLACRQNAPRDLPIVDVIIDGVPYPVLLDTGAQQSVFSSRLFAQNPNTLQTFSSLCIDSICFNNPKLIFANEAFFERENIAGLIGLDLLRNHRLSIRGATHIALDTPRDTQTPIDQIPILWKSGKPFINNCLRPNQCFEFLIDTGAVLTLLDEDTSKKIQASTPLTTSPARGCNFFGCIDNYLIADLSPACLGKSCFGTITIKFPVWNAIGFNVLSKFDLDIDLKNSIVTLFSAN